MTHDYQRLHILVEGPTEKTLVDNVIAPHLESRGWHITESVLGGVSRWSLIRRDLQKLLRDPSLKILTTLIDYYGFPADAPGMSERPDGSGERRVAHVEKAIFDELADDRFIPHLVLHEVESWVFAAADQVAELAGDRRLADRLRKDVVLAGGVEQVNDGPTTAPAKRLVRYWPRYSNQQTAHLRLPRSVSMPCAPSVPISISG